MSATDLKFQHSRLTVCCTGCRPSRAGLPAPGPSSQAPPGSTGRPWRPGPRRPRGPRGPARGGRWDRRNPTKIPGGNKAEFSIFESGKFNEVHRIRIFPPVPPRPHVRPHPPRGMPRAQKNKYLVAPLQAAVVIRPKLMGFLSDINRISWPTVQGESIWESIWETDVRLCDSLDL